MGEEALQDRDEIGRGATFASASASLHWINQRYRDDLVEELGFTAEEQEAARSGATV